MEEVVAEVDERAEAGATYQLRRRGAEWDILVDGKLAMSSGGPRLEKAIVELAVTPWGTRDDLTVLLAGLGMGLLLRELLDQRQVRQVLVLENVETIIAWAEGPLASLNRSALADKRTRLLRRELFDYLREPDPTTGARPTGASILVLDTDDWPVSLSRPENVDFYHDEGLLLLETALGPGGVFVTHAARRDDELDGRIRTHFQSVARVGVPVEVDGESRVQYVYRGRRSIATGGSG